MNEEQTNEPQTEVAADPAQTTVETAVQEPVSEPQDVEQDKAVEPSVDPVVTDPVDTPQQANGPIVVESVTPVAAEVAKAPQEQPGDKLLYVDPYAGSGKIDAQAITAQSITHQTFLQRIENVFKHLKGDAEEAGERIKLDFEKLEAKIDSLGDSQEIRAARGFLHEALKLVERHVTQSSR